MRKMFVLVLLAALLTVAVPVGAAPNVPDNYCTEVVITPIVGGTYDIDAIGAGRYARVRDLTTATTVVATDFGAGATVYSWDGLALDESHSYQVQVSHTSLTTGYSTTGCIFTPPPPLSVEMDYFIATRQSPTTVLVEWETISELTASHFQLYRGSGSELGVLVATMNAHPGSQYGHYYAFTDNAGRLRASQYTLIAWSLDNTFDEYSARVTAGK